MSTAARVSDDLSEAEVRFLNVLAFGTLRGQERRRRELDGQRRLRRFGQIVAGIREHSLIASMGSRESPVQPWEAIIGAEGQLTGDGRLIEFGALTFATFPLPLRFVATDHGGHKGAVLVGRIDGVRREADGLIRARGILDLGSEIGREAVRLIRARMLRGVSIDVDSSISKPARVDGSAAAVMTSGRVRAATLVQIAAFDLARIWLVGDHSDDPDDDCGCEDLATAGVATFISTPLERTHA